MKHKVLTLTLLMLLIAVLACNVKAEAATRIYTYSFAGIEVQIEYPFETYPNENITINIAIRALTTLTVNCTQLDLYVLHNATKEETSFYSISHISVPKLLGSGEWFNETYKVFIPEYAINLIYGKLTLKWTLRGTGEAEAYERELLVLMSYLKSLELESLRNENAMLREHLTNLQNELTSLSSTLNELRNNLTNIQKRYDEELSGTRSTIAVLAVTTVFFLATTAYLIFRKPKQYW
ncbi:hypothetical protein KEJ37_04415 [Candidatus Bathyarchaeota archaeon]|nr:hypothetical protein [Candidatus Bathyarchaeota archaeon]